MQKHVRQTNVLGKKEIKQLPNDDLFIVIYHGKISKTSPETNKSKQVFRKFQA